MTFTDSVAEVVADLTAGGQRAHDAVSRGLSLAAAVWTTFADFDPAFAWDLFGLDVCAAAEALHLGLSPSSLDAPPASEARSLRREAIRLVEAIAATLETDADDSGLPMERQLELHAAATQLRRAEGALT